MGLLRNLLYTALAAASVFYLFIKRNLSYWKDRGILHEKPKFLWGNLRGVGFGQRHVSSALQTLYSKYKGKAPFIGMYAYLKPMVLVMDPLLIEQILSPHTANFKTVMHSETLNEKRVDLSTRLSKDAVQHLTPEIIRIASKFVENLERCLVKDAEHKISFNLSEMADCYNTNVMAYLLFGLEATNHMHSQNEFRVMVQTHRKEFSLFQTYVALNYPLLISLWNFKQQQMQQKQQKPKDYFSSILRQQMEERSKDITLKQRRDLLNLCLNAEKPMSKEDITTTVIAFITKGLDSANSILTFCLYELALQPEVQEKARQEVQHVLQKHNRQFTYRALQDMTYMRQILRETLRKHSPVPYIIRATCHDYEIPDSVFMLQQNNQAVIPLAALNHDPELYENPEKFDPERFAHRKPSVATRLALGLSPQDCVAQQLLETQLSVALVLLLRRFRFSPCAETPIPLQYDNKRILLAPKNDIKLSVEQV